MRNSLPNPEENDIPESTRIERICADLPASVSFKVSASVDTTVLILNLKTRPISESKIDIIENDIID